MATPTTKMTMETEYYGRFALSGYNAFGFSDAEQAAFADVAAVNALMQSRINAQTYDRAEELRRYLEDWKFGAAALGVTTADVANSNTVAAFRAILTPFLAPGTPATFITQDHYTVVSA